MLQLQDLLRRDLVVELEATDKEGALDELVAVVRQARLVADYEEFHTRLLDREAQASTAMGMGVAIPHAAVDDLDQIFVVLGRSRQGIDFDAPDGEPVHLVFLFGLTNDRAHYLKLIQRISWILRNDKLRRELFEAETLDELHELLGAH